MDFGEKAPCGFAHSACPVCGDGVGKVRGKPQEVLEGTEFFRVIADVCLCPDLFRPGRVRPLAAVTQTSDINGLSVSWSMSWS